MDDPNIVSADSCTNDRHPVMSRLWDGRHVMKTIVIGLNPERERDIRQVATRLDVYRSSRHLAKSLRDRLRDLQKARFGS